MEPASNQNVDVVGSDVNSGTQNRNQKTDETEALDLYIKELMKLFRRGVDMGFLVKDGGDYRWNFDEKELEKPPKTM